MSNLEAMMNKRVQVVTMDGRVIQGTLSGADHLTNIVIEDTHEIIFSLNQTSITPLGVYLLRGDSLLMVSEIDTDKEERIDWEGVRCEPLKAMHQGLV
jgi:U6 snRNA-associated Sm-like protein LSm8